MASSYSKYTGGYGNYGSFGSANVSSKTSDGNNTPSSKNQQSTSFSGSKSSSSNSQSLSSQSSQRRSTVPTSSKSNLQTYSGPKGSLGRLNNAAYAAGNGSVTWNPQAVSGVSKKLGYTPVGIRANNPGNLLDAKWMHTLPGYTGPVTSPNGLTYAGFANPQYGLMAQSSLLTGPHYFGAGLNTVNSIVNRYAPVDKNNSSAANANYKSFLTGSLGVSGNAPLTRSQVENMGPIMATYENAGKALQTNHSSPAMDRATLPTPPVQVAATAPSVSLGGLVNSRPPMDQSYLTGPKASSGYPKPQAPVSPETDSSFVSLDSVPQIPASMSPQDPRFYDPPTQLASGTQTSKGPVGTRPPYTGFGNPTPLVPQDPMVAQNEHNMPGGMGMVPYGNTPGGGPSMSALGDRFYGSPSAPQEPQVAQASPQPPGKPLDYPRKPIGDTAATVVDGALVPGASLAYNWLSNTPYTGTIPSQVPGIGENKGDPYIPATQVSSLTAKKTWQQILDSLNKGASSNQQLTNTFSVLGNPTYMNG